MEYAIEVGVAIIQFVLSFYAFWLVWRVLLPDLPGPVDRNERIAPYAWYFTNPFVVRVARALHIGTRAATARPRPLGARGQPAPPPRPEP